MMMSLFRRYFISGLLVWLPVWITLLAITFLINLMSNTISLLPHRYQPDILFGFHIPFIGVLITLSIIFLTGIVAANFVGKKLVTLGDSLIGRIPLVRSVYTGVKQVTETLFTPGGQSFRKVILVQFPREGVWSMAFQTGDVALSMQEKITQDPMISFFIPTTPNPTSGFLMLAPKKDVIELDITVDQALKFIISLGVIQPTWKDAAEAEQKIVEQSIKQTKG